MRWFFAKRMTFGFAPSANEMGPGQSDSSIPIYRVNLYIILILMFLDCYSTSQSEQWSRPRSRLKRPTLKFRSTRVRP